MKRNKGLIPLSHDHHRSLVLALRLQRLSAGEERDLGRVTQVLLEHFENEMKLHFESEEEIIFPVVERLGLSGQALVGDLMKDHAALREIAQRLTGQTEDQRRVPVLLEDFGVTLEKHIRREEGVLFPLLEESLEGTVLSELGRRLQIKRKERKPVA